jgi:guanyl-specific ribonuclease Sa
LLEKTEKLRKKTQPPEACVKTADTSNFMPAVSQEPSRSARTMRAKQGNPHPCSAEAIPTERAKIAASRDRGGCFDPAITDARFSARFAI